MSNWDYVVKPEAVVRLAADAVADKVRGARVGRPKTPAKQLSVNFKAEHMPQAVVELARAVARRRWRVFAEMVPPVDPGVRCVVANGRGVSVRLVSQWNIRTDEFYHRFDVIGARA